MAILRADGFYLEIDESSIDQENPQVIFTFIQVLDQDLEKFQLTISREEIYLAHCDPTILAVCFIYDHQLWIENQIKLLIDVVRCTANYRSSLDETIKVVTLPDLIRLESN